MKKYIVILAAALASVSALSARNTESTLKDVKVTGTDVYRYGSSVNVEFTADFSDVDLGKNQQVIYTPVLTSLDGANRLVLDKIVLNGKNISIIEERSPKTRVAGAAQSLRRVNGTAQSVNYRVSAPYRSWMDNSTLSLSEDLCGCGDLKSQDSEDLATYGYVPEDLHQGMILCVEPQIEEPKIRNEKGSASVDFVVDKYDIRPDYRNNAAEINKIISTIDVVRNDANVKITDISIHAYASPEDTYEHNTFLAENRAKSLTEYVKSLYDIPGDIFKVEFTPENWEGLREYVAASDLEHRHEILDVIDDPELDPDKKDWRIKGRYPEDYAFLLKEVFPGLRRSDYIISYIVRPFSPEEALEVMKTTPKQVSLYEMFWAAQSLGVNTDGYYDVIKIAVDTYPDEPVANYNAAVMSVNKGDYEAALSYLEKAPENACTLNIKGVCYMNLGSLDTARGYFEQAVEQGMPEAAKNIELIDGINILDYRDR